MRELHRRCTAHLLHLATLGLDDAGPLRGARQVFAHARRADGMDHKRATLAPDAFLLRLTIKAHRMNESATTLIDRLTGADESRFGLVQIGQQVGLAVFNLYPAGAATRCHVLLSSILCRIGIGVTHLLLGIF